MPAVPVIVAVVVSVAARAALVATSARAAMPMMMSDPLPHDDRALLSSGWSCLTVGLSEGVREKPRCPFGMKKVRKD